jgi:hypothetical protein
LALKFETYLEKERLRPLHLTTVNFLVALAPSSSSNKISKYPLVKSVAEMNKARKWSLRQ